VKKEKEKKVCVKWRVCLWGGERKEEKEKVRKSVRKKKCVKSVCVKEK
jgi:hypothetical protein